jgi:hypothetical protein
MNSSSTVQIRSYQDLQNERGRLEMQIANQKNIVRHDFDELKSEFRKEIKPALEAAQFVKKFTSPSHRSETFLQLAAVLVIDLLIKKMLQRSGILLQLFLPGLAKKYTSRFVGRISTSFSRKRAQ